MAVVNIMEAKQCGDKDRLKKVYTSQQRASLDYTRYLDCYDVVESFVIVV